MKRNDNLRDLCWSLNDQHLHYRGLRRRREREKGPQGIFEKAIAENFPNMGKKTVTQVQEEERIPGRINSRRNILGHIIIKLTKTKDTEKIFLTRGYQ